jgi:hypothetical protein
LQQAWAVVIKLGLEGLPSVVYTELICVGMMVIVQNSPAMEGINERRKCQMAYQVINPAPIYKRAVTTIMPNYKKTSQRCAGKNPQRG